MCNSQTRSDNHKPKNKTYNSVICICFFNLDTKQNYVFVMSRGVQFNFGAERGWNMQLVLFVCAHFTNWFGRPFFFRGLMPLFPFPHFFFKCRAPPVKHSLPKTELHAVWRHKHVILLDVQVKKAYTYY